MLQRLNAMRGGSVQAQDGAIGEVTDFYFDDEQWTVRYVVVNTGRWLAGREVLIPLWALLPPDWTQHRMPVRLTRDQVRHSPPVDTHRPISRQMELEALEHYQFPLYWTGPALWGPAPVPAIVPPPPQALRQADPDPHPRDRAESHLRSCKEVRGYHVRTRDGEQGHVDDFLVDDRSWTIEHLLVDTSNWIGGKSVLISPRSVQAIDWSAQTVQVALSREALIERRGPAGIAPGR